MLNSLKFHFFTNQGIVLKCKNVQSLELKEEGKTRRKEDLTGEERHVKVFP